MEYWPVSEYECLRKIGLSRTDKTAIKNSTSGGNGNATWQQVPKSRAQCQRHASMDQNCRWSCLGSAMGFGRGSPSLYPNLPQQDFPPEFGRGKVVFRENNLTNRRLSQPLEPMDTGDEEKYEDAMYSVEAFAGASTPLESEGDLKECYFCSARFPCTLIANHIMLCGKKPPAIPDPQEENTSSMATCSKDTRGGGSGCVGGKPVRGKYFP
ncbi:unnamed protein product [Cyprideis torosa]|uniref:Uncharacterized protein n=1 Tax=Cyprideis torosa TaxID=163714 RepID=A0A7R8ZUH1_9CRUS|nr:unnamed protein product [Cyprideis torosa]CAG0908979.1 unnamed protein product [Cyprideis torosa]